MRYFEYFYQFRDKNVELDNRCVKADEQLMALGHFFGYDNLVNSTTFFEINSPFLRETVESKASKCSNRIRQIIVSLASFHNAPLASSLEFILATFYSNKRILLLEDTSFFASILKFLCQKHQIELVTSEFLGTSYQSGEIINEILNVDIQKTHFQTNYFDLIIHTDVFEHVPNAITAEKEIVRILNKNGAIIFTAPFEHDRDTDNIYAELLNDKIKYYQEPIYHEDPISEDGKCLVFRTFSFKDMKKRYNQLGCKFTCEYFHSRYLGILGNNAFTFIVTKS